MNDLIKIMQISEVDERILALSTWISTNIKKFEVKNKVIKLKWTSEEAEFVKYHLANQLAEELVEKYADLDMQNSEITIKLLVLDKNIE